jgi:hypothetical protein
MSKKFAMIFLVIGGLFTWANVLLTRPPSVDGAEVPEAPETRNLSGKPGSGVKEKEQVFREMASFVESHPEVLSNRKTIPVDSGHDLTSPKVLGFHLDQKTGDELMTREGLSAFQLRYHNEENLTPLVQDLNQAWANAMANDLVQRKALLGVNRGLAGISDAPALRETMLKEFDSYYSSENPNRNSEYASQALQDYLDHEKNEDRKLEELKKRGIPVYRAPASEDASVK